MKPIRTLSIFVSLTVLTAFFAGCAAYTVPVEERSTGTIIDDKTITLTIEKEFLKDETIKFLDFNVGTYEGVVYLYGEYENRDQIKRAVEIANSIVGVKSISTYFLPKSRRGECGVTDNVEINARLTKELVADKRIWSTNVDVEVIQCNIVLLGVVGSQEELQAVLEHAKATPGARSVKSFLTVTTRK